MELWRKYFGKVEFAEYYLRLRKESQVIVAIMASAQNINIPPIAPSGEPGPLYSDFFQQQVAKQRNNNYHSTSLNTMVATSVNRTSLHPGGVQYVSLSPFPFCLVALVFTSSLLSYTFIHLVVQSQPYESN